MRTRTVLLTLCLTALVAAGQPQAPRSPLETLTGNKLDDPEKKDEPQKKPNGDKKPNGTADKDQEEKEKGGEKEKEDKNGKDEKKEKDETGLPPWFSAHGQATVVSQGNFPLHAPYTGLNSLRPNANIDSTSTATLFLASRMPWEGGEVVFNPEVAGGSGLSGTTGFGGFPNGEATRVGKLEPTPYIARLFYRHTVALGGELEPVEDAINQPAGTRPKDRLVWQVGKFATLDVFGDNAVSHDPRLQFLNWSLMTSGAWDYPANVRGYTYGSSWELSLGDWSFTYGVFGEPTVANGASIDPRFLQALGHMLEVEREFKVNGRTAKVQLTPFLNRAHMGSYAEALAQNADAPDVTATRRYRIKYGFVASYEQELTADLGLLARYGWNDGRTETWAFTEIDRSGSVALLLKGTRWGRADDRLGVAAVVNGLSGPHRAYLAAGGVGFIVGDGRLNYAPEGIAEVFYNWRVRPGLFVTLDLQGILNPAYNRDRGPAGLLAVRLHYEF